LKTTKNNDQKIGPKYIKTHFNRCHKTADDDNVNTNNHNANDNVHMASFTRSPTSDKACSMLLSTPTIAIHYSAQK